MCKIINTRKTSSMVYIEIDDGEYWGVKKMPIEKFNFAKQFGNTDFLGQVGQWTTDRDFNASATAVPFIDPSVQYSV